MARIGENAFRQYRDGQDRLTAPEYMAERELIRLAVNDLDDKIQRTEGIREEFSNTVNEVEAVKGDVIQTKQEVDTKIGEFSQVIGQSAQDIQQTKAEVAQATEQLVDLAKVNVKYFGAKGDGVTDDSEAIKRAITALPKRNGRLYFPPGVYVHGDGLPGNNGTGNSYLQDPKNPLRPLINSSNPVDIGRDIRFRFIEYNNLEIEGYGATIKAHPNNGECRNNEIFYFETCVGLTIKGLKIDGSSHQRAPKFNDYNTGNGAAERGSLRISGGKNINLIDVTSVYSMMDGIQIIGLSGVKVDTVQLTNCNTDYAYRNGVTISTSKNVRISGGNFTNTGVTFGIAPKAGIDIEADWGGTVNEGVLVENAYFSGNVIGAIMFSVGAKNCRVVGCKLEGKTQFISFMFDPTRWGYNYVEKCHFINAPLSTESRGVKYLNNVFEVKPDIPAGQYPNNTVYGFFHLQGGDGASDAFVVIDNNIFKADLTNVSEDAKNVLVGQMWYFGRQNVEFTNNSIFNLYNSGLSQVNFRPSHVENSRTTGNRFEFNDTRLLPKLTPTVFAPIESRDVSSTLGNIKDNVINGYPLPVKLRGSYMRLNALSTGQYYVHSQVLDFNSVYEIDIDTITSGHAQLRYDIVAEFRDRDAKTIIQTDLLYTTTLTNFINSKPSTTLPTNLFFYKSGKKLYVKATGYYVTLLLKAEVHHGNGEYYIDSTKNCVKKVSESDISTLTALPYTANSQSVDTLTELTNFNKPIGYNVWVKQLNKVAWWDGVNWKDATGTLII